MAISHTNCKFQVANRELIHACTSIDNRKNLLHMDGTRIIFKNSTDSYDLIIPKTDIGKKSTSSYISFPNQYATPSPGNVSVFWAPTIAVKRMIF